jgi:predicted O-methyltransferase YrrM
MIGRYLEDRADGLLTISAEPPHRGIDTFTNFNLGGVEIEVGEFLYGLVRVMKPEHILETGTHFGISAAFMALALRENSRGRLTTIEIHAATSAKARELFDAIGVMGCVTWIVGRAEEWTPSDSLDMILLDTELHCRFPDMVRLWPYLRPGGILMIHDLHPHMDQVEGVAGSYGPFPVEIVELIRSHELQSLHLPTPRGFYLAQKAQDDFHSTKVAQGYA